MTEPDQPPSSEPSATVQPGSSKIALYSTQGIVIGTILGSLAAGVVMLYLNYRALGRAGLAKTVTMWGTALFITVILIASFAPNTAGFALLFMAIQAGTAWFLADKLQGSTIRYHQAHAGPMHSSLRAAAVGFLTGMALFFLLVTVSAIWLTITGAAAAA